MVNGVGQQTAVKNEQCTQRSEDQGPPRKPASSKPVARKGLQAKDRGPPLEVGEAKEKDSSLRPLEEMQPSDTVILASKTHHRLLISRTVREYILVVLNPKFVVICYSD